MNGKLFEQNVIAIIWDFDKTLIPGYMQKPIFDEYGVDEGKFWNEVNRLPEEYGRRGATRTSKDMVYLNHMLSYVRAGVFAGLSNARLEELGQRLEFYPGVPEVFKDARGWTKTDAYDKHDIELEHYVISTGLHRMIQGSMIAPYVDDVWACEFVEGSPEPGYLEAGQMDFVKEDTIITDIAYAIDNTSKTRALFEISKGCNKFPEIDVNSSIAQENRRIPFRNMIYLADGPSDIPVFSILNQYKGRTYAVYKAGSERDFEQANTLQNQGRVQSIGEANYVEGSQTHMWLRATVREIADRIVNDRQRKLRDETGDPPRHIV